MELVQPTDPLEPNEYVSSLNGLTGAVILAAGTGITLTPVGQTITIAATGDLSVSLSDVSANSTTTPLSLYQMTSTIPVEFRSSDGNILLYLDETNERIGVGTNAPGTTFDANGPIFTRSGQGFAIGDYTGKNRIVTYNTGYEIRFFDVGNSYADVGMRSLAIGSTYPANTPVDGGAIIQGSVGIGIGTTPSAKLQVLSTTEQVRIGYDVSNYLPITVSSAGIPTFQPTGNQLVFKATAPSYIINVHQSDSTASAYRLGTYADSAEGEYLFNGTAEAKISGRASSYIGMTATNNFGVGVLAPAHKIDVSLSSSSTGVSSSYFLRTIPSGTISSGSSINGTLAQLLVTGSTTISTITVTGGNYIAEHDGSSTVHALIGLRGQARTNAASTGVLTDAISVLAVAPNNAQAGNTIVNATSLKIESPTAGSTSNYGLYQDGSALNYFGGVVQHNAPVRLKGYTVAGLPAGTQGDRAFVTDATLPVYGAALTGGGAVVVPVFYNGAAWISA